MREIPMPYIQANQAGIILFALLALFLQQPYVILALWLIQGLTLLLGKKGSLFLFVAHPFVKHRLATAETQAAELQRFNLSLAMIFLTLSLVSFALGWEVAGYAFVVMLTVAAGVALAGYCIGCTLYFQYKQWKARRRLRKR